MFSLGFQHHHHHPSMAPLPPPSLPFPSDTSPTFLSLCYSGPLCNHPSGYVYIYSFFHSLWGFRSFDMEQFLRILHYTCFRTPIVCFFFFLSLPEFLAVIATVGHILRSTISPLHGSVCFLQQIHKVDISCVKLILQPLIYLFSFIDFFAWLNHFLPPTSTYDFWNTSLFYHVYCVPYFRNFSAFWRWNHYHQLKTSNIRSETKTEDVMCLYPNEIIYEAYVE